MNDTRPAGAPAGAWTTVQTDDAGDAIVAAMALGGIDRLFFTSGSEIGFYQEAIAKARALGRPAPKLVGVTHEYLCLNAALGYAAVSGKPVATAAHVDVGTQHYGCAIHTAWQAGLPVLITAGAPPAAFPGSMRGARDGAHLWVQQSFDQNGIVRPYVKWDHRLDFQDNPGLMVSRALQVAMSDPPGPVYLSLPRELVLRPAQKASFPTALQLGIPRPAAPDAAALDEIAQRLVEARNPVIVAGTGRDPACVPALVQLSELLGAPVAEMPVRGYQCFPMDHPLYIRVPNLKEADALLVLEANVPWMPGPAAPAPEAFVAVIGSDPIHAKIPTLEFTADIRLNADALAAIRALTAAVRECASRADLARIEERSARWRGIARSMLESAQAQARSFAAARPIHPAFLAWQIAQMLDERSLLVDDTTQNRLTPALTLRAPGSYFHNPGSGGGWGPGAAFGAKLAAPERDVVCVTGDGFYMFGVGNYANWAASHHGAPFMTVIFQNRSYATGTISVAATYPQGYAAKAGFEGGYFDPPVDFAKEAEATGAYGENVREPAEVGPALRRGLEQVRAGRPAVIAVWLARLMAQD